MKIKLLTLVFCLVCGVGFAREIWQAPCTCRYFDGCNTWTGDCYEDGRIPNGAVGSQTLAYCYEYNAEWTLLNIFCETGEAQ